MLQKIENNTSFINRLTGFFLMLYFVTVLAFADRVESVLFNKIAALLFICSCMLYILKKGKVRIDYYIVTFSLYIILAITTISFNSNIQFAITRVFTLVQILGLSFFIINYIDTIEKVDFTLKSLIIGTIVMYLVLIIKVGGFKNFISNVIAMDYIRIGGEVNQINTFGTISSFAGIISFWYAYYKKCYYHYFLLIVSFALSMLTASKKAMAVFISGVLLLILMKDDRKKVKNIIMALLFCFFSAYIVYTLPIFGTMFSRIKSMLGIFNNTYIDASTRIRSNMIRAGWNAFKKKPILGYGIVETYKITFDKVGIYTYLHNNFIEILAGNGILGFIIYYSLFVYGIIYLYKLKNNEYKNILLTLLIGLLLSDFAVVSYYAKYTHIILSIIFSTILVAKCKTSIR